MKDQFKTPVLFLVFNRPDKTRQVFERIRNLEPKYLYIAADGPRKSRPKELQKCNEVREIVGAIDWDCEPKYLLRDENMGCSKAIVSAIDWLFQNEENGIVLEDDCLPDPSFFLYCSELLDKYKDENQIMMISGSNMGHTSGAFSYFFSDYGQIWGWATWKRAWSNYEKEINVRNPPIKFLSSQEKRFWKRNFRTIIWDVQWAVYSVRKNKGIAILPNTNLISNIGFGPDATIYTEENSINANLESGSIAFPLIHPEKITVDKDVDLKIFKRNYHTTLYRRVIQKMNRSLFKK